MDFIRKVNIGMAAAALLGGCSSEGEEQVPAACLAGGGTVEAALRAAPDRVELDGTPLSGCLVKSSEPADIQNVGAAYLSAAAELGAAAARRPEGAAALRLGYLVGAVRRGSERTQGIHSELVRRIEQEAVSIAGQSAAYASGVRAGRRSG